MEKVSIIIPVYNGEEYLEETILSCIQQTYAAIEIIVVNDASSDNSERIIKKYEQQGKIKFRMNEINQGMMRSCNIGVSCSEGTKLMVLGQDDILPPQYVEHAMKCFENDTAFVFCNPQKIDEKGKRGQRVYEETVLKTFLSDLPFQEAKNNVIPSTGLLMDKRLMLACGGYEEKYRNYGEWKLWIRMLARGKGKYVEDCYTYYRVHSNNQTSSFITVEKQKRNFELQNFWLECQKEALRVLKIRWYKKILLWMRYILKKLICLRNKHVVK